MRLLLIGKAGSGKDTVADYLVQRYGFKRYAFADKLKQIAVEMFPDIFRHGKPRSLLQDIGAYFRSFDESVWVEYVLRRIRVDNPELAVISDCRYANELDLCLKEDVVPVLIDCPLEIRNKRLVERGDKPLTPEQQSHPSENDVFEALKLVKQVYVIDNSGTLTDLYRQVDELMALFGVSPIDGSVRHSDRPSWHKTFMDIALTLAKRSTCLRRQVGAVLVKDNRIIATGYNGAPKGLPHCSEAGCVRLKENVPSGKMHELCRAVHAEENCIIQAAVFGVPTEGSVIYTTHFPCSICARTLINAGVKAVYYLEGYPDELSSRLLSEAGIQAVILSKSAMFDENKEGPA